MFRILIVGKQNIDNEGLCSSLVKREFNCLLTLDDEKVTGNISRNPPDLVLIESDPVRLAELAKQIKYSKAVPVIALLEADMLDALDLSSKVSSRAHPDETHLPKVIASASPDFNRGSRSADSLRPPASRLSRMNEVNRDMNGMNRDNLGRGLPIDFDLIDDFLTKPYRLNELEIRIKRLLGQRVQESTGDQIKLGDLTIDPEKYEVSVGRHPILLTFKEYELLKCLAGRPGHVFTRDALLNRVWGYEYYGGDRTVDVHIKRLRSKIEDANHTFIETIRNIGYRFRSDL